MSTEYSKTRVAQLADESREPSLEGRPDSDAMLVARAKSGDLGSLDLLIGQHRSRGSIVNDFRHLPKTTSTIYKVQPYKVTLFSSD